MHFSLLLLANVSKQPKCINSFIHLHEQQCNKYYELCFMRAYLWINKLMRIFLIINSQHVNVILTNRKLQSKSFQIETKLYGVKLMFCFCRNIKLNESINVVEINSDMFKT